MKMPDSEVMKIRDLIEEMGDGSFPAVGVAHAVAECVIKYEDEGIFSIVPSNIVSIIDDIVISFREKGSFSYISNLGEVDRTEFARSLANVWDRVRIKIRTEG